MMSVYREKREVWEHIILLLSDGICRYVYVADVFLVRCWSVAASVLAAVIYIVSILSETYRFLFQK